MVRVISFSLFLLTMSCCSYVYYREFRGLMIEDKSKTAITGNPIRTFSDSTYELNTEIASTTIKYSSVCPISDSILGNTHFNKLQKNRKDFGIKKISIDFQDQFVPISNYSYTIEDTSIIEIISVHSTIIPSTPPDSVDGVITFKIKKDGETELVGTSKKGKGILRAPIVVKNLIVINSGFPKPIIKKYSTGSCKCSQ